MSWPLPQDYNEAIQSPHVNFSDPELRAGGPVLNALGLPIPCSGNFADVYEVRSPSGGRWAVKCFTREVPRLRERYAAVSRHLREAHLPFTVDFTFLDEGIRVRGRWYPALKMQWVEGLTLNEFVRRHADRPAMLESLLQIWVRMAARLRAAGVAHADLQHGNVLLVPGSTAHSLAVKLVDYDGMFVPALAGSDSGEVGHPCYQHPQRAAERTYSAEVDRFPLLLIATALCAVKAGGGELWDRYNTGDNLLFREADLRAPDKSSLFAELLQLPDERTARLTRLTLDALKGRLESAPLLEDVLPELLAAPSPRPAAARARATETVTLVPVTLPAPAAEVEAGAVWDFEGEEKPLVRRRRKGGLPLWVWGVAAASVAALLLVGGVSALGFWVLTGRAKSDASAQSDPHTNHPAPLSLPNQLDGQGPQGAAEGHGAGGARQAPDANAPGADGFVPLEVTAATSEGGTVLTPQPDGSVLAGGANPFPETYTVTARTKLRGITGLRLEVLYDPSLPAEGPGRADNGNFVLNELKVAVRPEGTRGKPVEVALRRARATFSQDVWPVAGAIDGDRNTGWAVLGPDGKGRAAAAYFKFQRPVAFPRGAVFTVTMQQCWPGRLHNIGRFRLAVTAESPAVWIPVHLAADASVADLRDALREDDPAVQETALLRLANLGPAAEPAVADLAEVLADDKSTAKIRALAAVALNHLVEKARPAVGALVQALRPAAPVEVRQAAAEALAQMRYPANEGAVPALLEAIRKDSDPAVRQRAVWALFKLKDLERFGADKVLTEVLDETAPAMVMVRYDAARKLADVLRERAPDRTVAVLLDMLQNKNLQVFKRTEPKLDGPGGAGPGKVNLQASLDGDARFMAAQALGWLGAKAARNPEVVPALRAAAAETDPRLREQAQQALKALTADGKGPPPAQAEAARDNPPAAEKGPPREVHKWEEDAPMRRLTFSPDGKYLLAGGAEGLVRVYNVATRETVARALQPQFVQCLALSPDGKKALIGSTRGREGSDLLLWDWSAREVRHRVSFPFGDLPLAAGFAQGGTRFVTCNASEFVHAYNVGNGKEVGKGQAADRPRPAPGAPSTRCVAFSADGKYVFAGRSNGEIHMWNLANGRDVRVFIGHGDAVSQVAPSADGRWLLSGGADRTARVWDATTGKEKVVFRGHGNTVLAVALSRDGKLALSAAADSTLRLWDAGTSKELHQLVGHLGFVAGLAFSPDGKYLATAGNDRTVRLWQLP